VKNPIQKFYEFLDRPIFPTGRVLLALAVIPLGFAVVKPLWRISMEAPQYPEGLSMEIFSYALEGGHEGQDLVEINTLNHYIGMHHISEEEIPDLGWMPFALGILMILTLRVAAIGNVRGLVDHMVLTTYVLGFLAVRFIYRMYVYGHDLDPRAAVTVQPFWPVIIGTKQIANFTTHGIPLLGTYLILTFTLVLGGVTLWHLVQGRRHAARLEREAGAKRDAVTAEKTAKSGEDEAAVEPASNA